MMTSRLKRLAFALAAAALPVVVVFNPAIYGVSAWKWVLAIIGLVIFMLAGRSSRP